MHTLGQLALLAFFLMGAYGAGIVVLRVLGPGQVIGVERWLFGQALGLGVLSLLTLGLGALGLYRPMVAWLVLGAGVILTLPDLGRRQPWRTLAIPRGIRLTIDRLVLLGLALVVLLALGFTLFANALVPPVSYDAVAYHLAIPKLYVAAGRLVYIPFIVYSNWPLGNEMLFVLSLLLGSEFLPQLLTWSFAILIAVGLVTFGRRWLSPWSGPIAAAIFFSLPMLLRLAGTGLIEVPLAGYSFLAFYALWRWHETGTGRWLVISALLSGCAAGSKLNGAGVAIVLGAMAFLLESVARRPGRGLRAFTGYGAVSFMVAFPWYLKSWLMTGNPLWPFLYPLFGGRDWDALGVEYLLGYIRTTNLAPTVWNWLSGFWRLTTDGLQFGSFLLGPYLLGLVPLVVLEAVLERNRRLLLGTMALFSLGLYSIWFLLTHQTRFLMPAIPVLSLLAAEGVAWVCGRVRPGWIGRLLQVALLAWLLAGAWFADADRRHEWSLAWTYLTGGASREEYLTSVSGDYPAFAYANQHLPQDAVVLLAPFESRGFYLDHSYIWANPIGQRLFKMEQIPDVAAFAGTLRRMGVTHILFNTRIAVTDIRHWTHIDGLFRGLVDTEGHLLFSSAESSLYELRSGSQ